jgi:hypothetical protein
MDTFQLYGMTVDDDDDDTVRSSIISFAGTISFEDTG